MTTWPLFAIATGFMACSIVAQAASAATVDRGVPLPCTISGFLSDPNPNGIDVRSAPRADAPVIGHLPPPAPLYPGNSERFGAEFNILGVRDGWLLISEADVEFNDQVKVVFKGPGWIPGDKVGFIIGSQELREAPANDAKVIARLSGKEKDGTVYGSDSYRTLRVHACQGHFVEVTIAPPHGVRGQPLRGWLNKVCSNQKTTCDSSVADPDRRDGP